MTALHAKAGINTRATFTPERKGNARDSGYDRSGFDWYREPDHAVHALLNAEPFPGSILDPACGGGTIPRVFGERGHREVFGSDIVRRIGPDDPGANGEYWAFVRERDFLTASFDAEERPDCIVSNPPYAVAEDFIAKAIQTAKYKVAMLLRLSFLEGQRRRALLDDAPLSAVHVFAYRISMPPGGTDVQPKGGSVAFAWFVWTHGHRGPATINRLYRPSPNTTPHWRGVTPTTGE